MGSDPKIAAVVLNYRTPDDTFLSVRSLLASRRPLDDIIVVNNDAASTNPAILQSCHPAIDVVATGANLGFSGGVNVGIRAALERGADAVLLVNSDVILPPDSVGRLQHALTTQRQNGCGIVGPVVVSRSDPGMIASLGMSYNESSGRMLHRGFGEARSGFHDADATKIVAVSGCAMLISRAVFDAIGLFDEDYFFSFEDLDFCMRARSAGFETMVAADATAYHEGGRSIGAWAPERLYFAARNHLLMASRATPARSVVRHASRVISIVILNLVHATISRGAPLPRRLAAVVRGTKDYVSGRFGPAS